MSNFSRELLVTTKVAQHWQDDFDSQVNSLMSMVNHVDTDTNIGKSSEIMNIYKHMSLKDYQREYKKQMRFPEKPFEFMVFRN